MGLHPKHTTDYATSWQTLYIFINGTNVSGSYLSPNGEAGNSTPPDIGLPGRVFAAIRSGTQNTNGGIMNFAEGISMPGPRFSTDTNPATGHLYLDESSNVTTLASLPIQVSGTEIGLPTMTANRSDSPRVRLAFVQVYFGQFIDPTNSTNLHRFITATGSPVAPSVAQAAFGTPSYIFNGDASAFIVNGGTSGSVTKTGTVTDYSPGP